MSGQTEGAGLGPRLVVVAALVWLTGRRVLVHRRPHDARFGAGALELPGGKVERGESPRLALARELVEEWGPGARCLTVGPVAEVLHHIYPPPGPEVILIVHHVDGAALSRRGPVAAMGLTPEPGVIPVAYEVAALPVADFLAADRAWVATVREGIVRAPFGAP